MNITVALLLLFSILAAVLAADPPADCPECGLRPDEIILGWGYPVESHYVQTRDGFNLRMYRIPYGVHNDSAIGSRPPVLIMHGLLDSASTWVANLPDQSLPFILADAGYDVWLGNNRGCKWSMPSCDTEECWDFSFDECKHLDVFGHLLTFFAVIQYDFPDMIDFALSKSHASSLTYIGHSQGTLQGFGGLAYNTEVQKKVNLFVALAPVAYVYNIE
jgi:pimeloyl-ACP methyl ester carboxylesterase